MTDTKIRYLDARLQELKARREAIRLGYDEHRWPEDATPRDLRKWRDLGKQINQIQARLDVACLRSGD